MPTDTPLEAAVRALEDALGTRVLRALSMEITIDPVQWTDEEARERLHMSLEEVAMLGARKCVQRATRTMINAAVDALTDEQWHSITEDLGPVVFGEPAGDRYEIGRVILKAALGGDG